MKIVDFTNPSGKVAWRASGRTTRGGGRVRKNFPSRAEAEAYLEDMLGDRRDRDYRHRMQRLTWLSPDQVRDAELAAELAPDVFVVEMAREYVARHETIRGVELGTALSEYKKDRLAAGVRQVTVDTTGYILATGSRSAGQTSLRMSPRGMYVATCWTSRVRTITIPSMATP